MKSVEELINIARDPRCPPAMDIGSPDFEELLKHARDIEKDSIDSYVFVDSLGEAQREKIEGFFSEYGGHSGESLKELREEHQITDNEYLSIKPFIETMDRYNYMCHAIMEMPYDCQGTICLEQFKSSMKSLKENHAKISRQRYEEIMLSRFEEAGSAIKSYREDWLECREYSGPDKESSKEYARFSKKLIMAYAKEFGKLFLSNPRIGVRYIFNTS